MPIYMTFEGIKGDVTAEGFTDHIEIMSMSLGVSRHIGSPTGGSKDRESSAPSVSDFSFMKSMDESSYQWLEKALYGEGVKAVVKLVKTNNEKLEEYASYNFENCLVSSYQVSGSGSDRPVESVSISFTKLEFVFTEMKEGNEAGDPKRTSYDISKAKK